MFSLNHVRAELAFMPQISLYCTYVYGSNRPSGVTCRRGGNQRPGRRPGVSRATKNGNFDRELPFLEGSPVPKVVVTCDLGNATKGL